MHYSYWLSMSGKLANRIEKVTLPQRGARFIWKLPIAKKPSKWLPICSTLFLKIYMLHRTESIAIIMLNFWCKPVCDKGIMLKTWLTANILNMLDESFLAFCIKALSTSLKLYRQWITMDFWSIFKIKFFSSNLRDIRWEHERRRTTAHANRSMICLKRSYTSIESF